MSREFLTRVEALGRALLPRNTHTRPPPKKNDSHKSLFFSVVYFRESTQDDAKK